MTNPIYKIVLSDKLYCIYKKATICKLKPTEMQSYENLIGNIELDILTNAAQLERCKKNHNLPNEIYDDLLPVLLAVGDEGDLSLEELSKKTLFKFIVTQANEHVEPPYLNIKNNDVKRNYNITLQHDQKREKLHGYLTNLLQKAEKVLIHDPYFSCEDDNKKIFDLLPKKKIYIQYIENGDASNGKFIHSACKAHAEWDVQKCDTTQAEHNRFARSHDRYLIIDDRVEITLTSGFSYIWNESKEITCIIRKI
jgi:hypothetical protein